MNFYGIYFQNTASPCLKSPQFFNWKKINSKQKHERARVQRKNYSQLPSTSIYGFWCKSFCIWECCSNYRQAISLPHGLESRSEFWKPLSAVLFSGVLLCTPCPAPCLSWSLILLLSFFFQLYLLPLPPHSPSLVPLLQPWATHFEAILIKHSVDLRSNCSA